MPEYKPTTNKLLSSRLIKFSLIGIGVLFALRTVSFIITVWILMLVKDLTAEDQFKIEAFLKIADLIAIPVAGAIATIITAIIARYGLRESSGNIADGFLHKGDTNDKI